MTKKWTLGGIASAALMLFAVQPLNAGTIRCGVHLIHDGGRQNPGKYEVLKKCGEPTFRQGNTWIYDSGSKPRNVLRFNDAGLLSSIQ